MSGLMCSYNSVNGVPSCANDWLLNDVARGEWGLDGYVTADCDADADVVNTHPFLVICVESRWRLERGDRISPGRGQTHDPTDQVCVIVLCPPKFDPL